jgi:predicted NAD/FAD-binding protein
MPRDLGSFPQPLDIAVIGGGVAGLSAAWLLSHAHRVTVYEQERRLGGHSHTVDVAGPDGPIPVDTGFIVYNEVNYPNLTALFDHLGVASRASNMSFAASIDDGGFEYAGSGLGGLLAQGSNLLRAGFWRMLLDILRFYRTGHRVLARPDAEVLTLGQFLHTEGYSHEFIQHHLLPVAAAIWSSPVENMSDHPAVAFVRFCMAHGLMRIGGRPQWRTVEGGSRRYVERLTARFHDRIRAGSPVIRVRRTGAGVLLQDASGNVATHDHVVIATHADQALAMLGDADYDERRLLGAFTYTSNRAVLHRDPALMPRRRRVWSSWNYISRPADDRRPRVCVTYWMNALQGLDPRIPLFVTLNPCREPAPDLIEGTFHYDHPTYHRAALRAQRDLSLLQGTRNTWFCGSYFGAGFHEDALSAGLNVAERLGGLVRPWAALQGGSPTLQPAMPSAAE